MNKRLESGFTIVELMIALSVFSAILVLSTTVVIGLSNLFTKGITQTNTQNVTRNLVNELASQLQLGGAAPVIPTAVPGGPNVVCLGNQRYTFVKDTKLTEDNKDHVLWRDTLKNSAASLASCVPVSPLKTAVPTDLNANSAITGTELLARNMRLTDFDIKDNGNGSYTIKVTVAYGGSELDGVDDLVQKSGTRTYCQSGAGSQYCAVSTLTQIVTKRGIY